ncbi:MAG: hypothetical protein V3V19_11305 [Cocleimonas sp.]
MTLAKDAINTVLIIDHASQVDNWGAYDRGTVQVALRDDEGVNPSLSIGYDRIFIFGTNESINHPTLCLPIIESDSVVRVDIRSTNKDRAKTLREKVEDILAANLTNLVSPWNYMEFEQRGIDMSRNKFYRYIMEVRLYNIHEDVTA